MDIELLVVFLALSSWAISYFYAFLPDWALWPGVVAACCAIAWYVSKPILHFWYRRRAASAKSATEAAAANTDQAAIQILSHMRAIRSATKQNRFPEPYLAEQLHLDRALLTSALHVLQQGGKIKRIGDDWMPTD